MQLSFTSREAELLADLVRERRQAVDRFKAVFHSSNPRRLKLDTEADVLQRIAEKFRKARVPKKSVTQNRVSVTPKSGSAGSVTQGSSESERYEPARGSVTL